MPLFMDIHNVEGATPGDLAKAHEADLEVQHKHHVHCLKYWFNEERGKVFCLFDAPNAEAAQEVHREAHGLMAEKIIAVDPEIADGILGDGEINDAGAVVLPGKGGRDPGIRSVMFTDIVGSTDMTQKIGDEAAMAFLDAHDRIVRGALTECNGREVKHTGDGIMASFVSAACAVRCACRIQGEFGQCEPVNGQWPLQVRIGLAAGEPVEQRNDLFGSTIQLAARLCAHADPGQILVSNVVAELCIGKGIEFTDVCATTVKGFEQPVHTRVAVLTCN